MTEFCGENAKSLIKTISLIGGIIVRNTFALTSLVLAIFLTPALGQDVTTSERVLPVHGVEIVVEDLEILRTFSGTIAATNSETLSFSRPGCISNVNPELSVGVIFEGGTTLFELDDREIQRDVEIAIMREQEQKAFLDEQHVAREVAQSKLNREIINLRRAEDILLQDQASFDRNIILAAIVEESKRRLWTQQDIVAEAEDSLKLSDAAVERSSAIHARSIAEVNGARLELDFLQLKAPFEGTIVEIESRAGECVLAGQSMATIIEANNWQVELFIPLSIIENQNGTHFQLGDRVDIVKGSGEHCNGEILTVGQSVLLESQVVPLLVKVAQECPVNFFVNEAVQTALPVLRLKNVVKLPVNAIREGDRIFVIDNESRLASRTLNFQYIFDGTAYVRFNSEDESVAITSPPALAMDGMAVQLVDALR